MMDFINDSMVEICNIELLMSKSRRDDFDNLYNYSQIYL